MRDFILSVMFAFGSVFIVGLIIIGLMSEDSLELSNQAEQAKLECESTLPRNQHCEVIIKAIPIEE